MTLLICLFPIDYTTSAVYRTHDEVNICVVLKTLTTDVFANTNEKEGSWKLLGSTKEILVGGAIYVEED